MRIRSRVTSIDKALGLIRLAIEGVLIDPGERRGDWLRDPAELERRIDAYAAMAKAKVPLAWPPPEWATTGTEGGR